MDLNYQIPVSHSFVGTHKIEEGMSLRFVVSHIDAEENLLKVWIQMDPASLQRINDCIQKLKDYLERPGGYMHQRQLTLGSRYLVKPADSDNWYRAVILRHPPSDGFLVVVHYIDYGHTGLIHVNNVRSFNEKLFSIVPQATKCIMAGVASATGEAWSQHAVEYLSTTLRNKEFLGTVVNVFRDIPYIQIMVNGIPLSHHLIEKRLGVPFGSSAMPPTSSMILSGIETYRALPLDASQEHLIYVSHIESPQKFYIQLACKEPELNTLMEHIDRYATEHGFYPLEQVGLLPGTPCITQFSEDRTYYRAIITTVMGNSCRVTYVDYGNSEIKSCSELKAIPREFLMVPAQARECALPTEVLMDINTFHEAVDDKVLSCRIIRQQGTTYFVMLFSEGTPIIARSPPNDSNYTLLNLSLGTTHNVFITYVYSPLRFYCQLAQNTTQIESLMADIASFYQKLEPGANPLFINDCRQGKPVCAKFTEDELWYRAVVLTPAIQNTVAVQFVDYGNEDKVDLESIKRLTPSLLQLPIQGLPFGLSNLETFPIEVLESNAVIDELERLTLNTPLVAKLESKIGDIYSVSLFNISSSPPVCINSKLQEFIQMSNTRDNWQSVNALNSRTAKPLSSQMNQHLPKQTKDVTYDDLYPSLSEGTLEEVIVTDSSGPESFYCQFRRDSCELDALMDDLAEHYNTLGENEETISAVMLGLLCVAKYTEDDNWYRAKIVGVLRSGGVEVLYVDYGNREQINISRVKRILPQFVVLPIKAVECSLANFDVSILQPNVVESFNATVLDSSFTAIFKGRKENVYNVELLDSQENKINEKFHQMCKPAISNNWEPEKKSFTLGSDGGTWNENPKENISASWDSKHDATSANNHWNTESTLAETASKNNNDDVVWNETDGAELASQSSSFDSFPANKPYKKEFREPRFFDNTGNDKGKRRNQDDPCRGRQPDRMPNRDQKRRFGDSSSSNERSNSRNRYGDSWSPKGNQTSLYSDSSTHDSSSHYNKNQFNAVKELAEYKEIDIPCGSFRYINVLQVVNPNEFYCQLVDHTSELSLVMEQIGQVYGALRNSELSLNNPQTGKICCALFSKDCAWYRARIKSVVDNSAEVFFVDYGNSETVPLTSIKILKQEFLNLPMQTLKCSCLGIKPEGTSWTEKDIITFKDMAEEKSLLAQFVSKENNTTFLVNLIPVDKLKEGMLNKEFLNSGHGKKEETTSPQLKVPYSLSLQANLVKPVLNSGEKAEVVVTWAFSVEMFFCQLTSFVSQFQDMMNSIQEEYNNMSELEAVIDRPQLNTYCMSQFSEDGVWYRAKIMHIQGNDISVYYVDYGNNEKVRRKSVKYILPEFTTLPTQAITCTLNGIKAAGSATINESIFQKYFVGNTICTFVSDCDDHYLVDLENDGKSVAQLLVNDRLAVPAGDMKFEILESTRVESIPKLDFTQKRGKFVGVIVSYAESPYKFWCQPTSEFEKLNEVSNKIESHYSLLDNEIENATNLHEGDPCVAKFTEDEQWYRAIIKSCQNDKAEVLFVDYGNCDLVPLHQVKLVSPELMSIPAQAIFCTLHRIPPTLTEDQQTEFTELVDGKTMTIQIADMNSDGALVVTLYDNSSDPKVNIAEKLYGELLEDVPAILNPHLVPEGLVDGYISLVNSVSDFYIQLASDEEDIYKLKEDLAQYYNAISPEDLSVQSPKLQMACCAKYSDDDSWYRAVITNINGEQCTVHFVDFGNEENLPLSDIKILKEEFLALPYLTLRCCLNGVEPISGDTWSTSANDWLFEFTQEKTLQILFHSNDPISVTLSFEGGDIADNMISAELATRKDEPDLEVELVETIKENIENKKEEQLAIVSHVSSAESFYITFADKSDELYNFHEKLQEMYSDESDKLIDCSVSQKCVAKFSEDEAWYRAEVIEVSGDTVTIKFIDYGNSETIMKDNLKIMQSDLILLDPFAVECTLFGLKPNPEKLEEAKDLLEILIQDKEVKLEIIGEQAPCYVNVKIDGKDIEVELLENNFYLKTTEVSNLEKAKVDDMNLLLYEDTENIIKNERSATVPHIASAELFYITFSDKADELLDLHEKLQQIYNDESEQLIDCVFLQKCVAKFNVDEAWYRAEVMEVSEELVTVRFIDYGNSETTTSGSLKIIQPDLLSIDPFATECTFCGLKPKPELFEEAKNLLEELILEKEICVEVIREHKPLYVNLIIDGKSITNQLLQSELFVETNEVDSFAEANLDRLYISVPFGKNTVIVSHILSPSEFYVQLCDNLPELNILAEKIAETYAENSTVQDLAEAAIGQTCVAFDPIKQKWARALVTEQKEDEVEVTFVDYGNKSYISTDSIKQILPELQNLPFQSMKCSFGEICSRDDQDWNDEACTFFQKLVANEEKVLTAEFQEKKHCYIVKLFDMDNDIESIIVENGMAYRKSAVPVKPLESPVIENTDIDESSSVFNDSFSDEAEVQNITEANLELSYDSKEMKSSEYQVPENADTDESSGFIKDDISSDENYLQNNMEANLDLPYDKDMKPSEFVVTENGGIKEDDDISSGDKAKLHMANEANLEVSCDKDVKSSESLLTENVNIDENSDYLKKGDISDNREKLQNAAKTNLESPCGDELYVSDEDYDGDFLSEELGGEMEHHYAASITKNDTANYFSESSEISGFVSIVDSMYASAEDYSTPASDGNICDEICGMSLEANEELIENGPLLHDENSSDAVDSKDSMEIPCESSPKHDAVSTHMSREEKIVPGQVSYIETLNVQHETNETSSEDNGNSSGSIDHIVTCSTDNEQNKCDAVDREINESKLGICPTDESPDSKREFDVSSETPFHQMKLCDFEQLQNSKLCKMMESSPKDTCLDTEGKISECDGDSGTGNTSFTTSSAANSTTDAPGESSHTTSTSGTSEQEHEEMFHKSVIQKVSPGHLSFSGDANNLCDISAYDKKENVTDRTIEGHATNDVCIQQEESDKRLQRLNISAEDKIVPGQLSYFTESS